MWVYVLGFVFTLAGVIMIVVGVNGATVWWMVIIGALLLVLGLIMMRLLDAFIAGLLD